MGNPLSGRHPVDLARKYKLVGAHGIPVLEFPPVEVGDGGKADAGFERLYIHRPVSTRRQNVKKSASIRSRYWIDGPARDVEGCLMNKHPVSWLWAALPYVATWVGVVLLDQAVVAVGLYHVGILICLAGRSEIRKRIFRGFHPGWSLGLGGVCLLTAPLLVALWPWMLRDGVDLGARIAQWGLEGDRALWFVLYSVLAHPVLEEAFWRGALPDRMYSDILFAGFHLLVLAPLVHAGWLPLAFGVLMSAAWIWRWMARRTGGLAVPILTHALADFGIVVAVGVWV